MVSDALLTLQAQTTSTATAHSTGLALPKGIMIHPLYARIDYSAASQASGSGVFTFGLSVSYDGGSTWNADWNAPDKAITLTTSNQSGEFAIPFQVQQNDLVQAGSGVQIRVDAVLSGSPVTPTITWSAVLQPGRL